MLDLWARFKAERDWRALLSDGLHLSPQGERVVFEGLRELIEAEVPEAAPGALPLDLPLHCDIEGGAEHERAIRPYL